MNDNTEDFERDLEQLAEEYAREIREDIEEAAALALCFPGTEAGNDAVLRLKQSAKEHAQIYWRWVSEKFPEQQHWWQGGLETAMGSSQPEGEESE